MLKKWNLSLLFYIALLGCVIILFFPLLLRIISKLEPLSKWFLSTLHTHDNKKIYLETVGALWGSFLAVTGAIWAQARANKQKEQSEKSINAKILASDLKNALDCIVSVFRQVNNRGSELRNAFAENQFTILPNWRSLALTIGQELGNDNNISLLLSSYEKLEEILALRNYIDNTIKMRKILQLCSELIDTNTLVYKTEINNLIEIIRKYSLKTSVPL